MGISIEGYRPEYCAGVIACLQRNYDWMSKADSVEVEHWMHPTISYQWRDDVLLARYPYKYGIVLLSDDTVVGFFGCMYSRRYDDGEPYIYLTGTNWCIDEKYRMYLVPILKKMYATADVVGEFTPRKSVEEVLVNIFKFQYINREKLRFSPIPFLGHHELEFKEFSSEDFSDPILQGEFLDNMPYGVKCVEFRQEEEYGYVFYQVMKYHGKWIQVVKTVNGTLFARHAHEIVWRIQQKECFHDSSDLTENICEIVRRARDSIWMNLEAEKCFFSDEKIQHPMYDSTPVVRLALNKRKNEIQPSMDFLYSEMVMLELR